MYEYDKNGKLGNEFGGQYMPETLMPLLKEIQNGYDSIQSDKDFWNEYNYLQKYYVGRPSPLYFAERLTKYLGGAKVYFKRDELNFTGAHKINNVIGQILLAKKLGKTRIIAETGAGQHGVATATLCARFGLKCKVYMGYKDVKRQSHNVFRMKLLGAEVEAVQIGDGTLRSAMNATIRDWVNDPENTYYLIGTAAGPHPYPKMVKQFQSIIGREAREQILEMEGKLPNIAIAVIGGGSNAIGLFSGFLDDKDVKLIGIEAGGKGIESGKHSATFKTGKKGVLHGNLTYMMQDDDGQILDTYSIAAGLDYPGIGPEHSYLHEIGRAEYRYIMDNEAMNAFDLCAKLEGIIPAIEPSHAIAEVIKIAPKMNKDEVIMCNVCGRGDKDIHTAMEYFSNI